MNIAVPAFFLPQSPDWSRVYAAVPAASIAVLNIDLDKKDPKVSFPAFQASLGPWAPAAPQIVTQAHMRSPSLLVLGYVPTDDATGAVPMAPVFSGNPRQNYRTLTDIKSYVNHWYDLCPTLDGVFFDEGPAAYRFTGAQAGTTFPAGYSVDPQIQTFYADLYAHVKTKAGRGTLVLLNASEFMDEWVMGPTGQPQVADTVELFEGECARYEGRYTAQPWISNYPPARILHVIHTCRGYRCLSDAAQMIRMVALAQQRGAGLVYVFDGTSAGYNTLPSYWTEEVAAVQDLCAAIRDARGRALDELLRVVREGLPRLFIGGQLQLAWGCVEVYMEMGRRARALGC